MEPEKRKRRDDGEEAGKRAKGGHDINGGESTVTEEEEVEEFFAILRRIHVAVKYFQKANAGGRKSTGPPGNDWRPSFLLEDSEEDDVVKHEGKQGQEDSGLDLNSEPVTIEDRKIT